VEVGPVAVEAFVRDHGAGFDPDAVPGDRLGVRESILGRMHRHGGTAAVRRLEDGTEVSLRLPVTDPHTVEQDADAAPHDSEGAP
jgi:signal transduction histidine kinase